MILNKNNVKRISYKIKTEKIIKKNDDINYIVIDNYKLIVRTGNEKEVLDSNNVYLLNNSSSDNYFLAGHNSKLVFNRIYNLNLNDEVLFHINKNNYSYVVIEKKYIDVDDYSVFNKKSYDSLTLITCSFTNQKRYIVVCKRKV